MGQLLPSRPEWYMVEDSDPSFIPAKEAFDSAVRLFKEEKEDQDWAEGRTTVHDLLGVVKKAKAEYDDEKKHRSVQKWLVKFSKRVHYYGNIMDVMVQHHPEYVSLAWGTMKILFVGVINHQNLLASLAKGLAQIAGALPRMELSAILYPTERMKQALSEIYASILTFLCRAHGWFREGRLARAFHSLTRPSELRYDDLLKEIESSTRHFDSLAVAASQAEQRDMHLLILEVKQKLIEHQQQTASHNLNANAMLSDLQFSQILTYVSNLNLEDPEKSLQLALFHRNRSRARNRDTRTEEFWLGPKFKNWSTTRESSLIMIQGTFAARAQIKDFLVSMIEFVRDAEAPILWAVKPTQEAKAKVSVVDILKYLTSQALRLRKSIPESTARNVCARFQTAVSEAEWVELLAASLVDLPQLYIVVDVELLSTKMQPLAGSMTLPAVFWSLFQHLQKMPDSPPVKVVLVSYGSIMFHEVEDEKRHLILLIRGSTKRPGPRTQGKTRPLRMAVSVAGRII